MTDRICVAQIGAAHGIRGEVRLRSFTEDPMAVTSYGPLESEDGTRRFEIEALRPAKDHFVARLAGVADRDAAEKLTNLKLYVPRDRLPPVEDDDTFYHADLVGLAAVTPDGAPLGTVTAVHNFGAGDLIEITAADGGEPLLVPFTDDAVPAVDIKARRIVVVPPAADRVTDDVARHRAHDLSRDVSRAARRRASPARRWPPGLWSLDARRHPRARHRQAPHRRRHAGRRRPRHGDEGRRAGARASMRWRPTAALAC